MIPDSIRSQAIEAVSKSLAEDYGELHEWPLNAPIRKSINAALDYIESMIEPIGSDPIKADMAAWDGNGFMWKESE